MEVLFVNKSLKKLYADHKWGVRKLGKRCADSLLNAHMGLFYPPPL